jgi:hypothetical protein
MTTKGNFDLLSKILPEAYPENANDSFAHCPPGWTKDKWEKEMDFSDHPFFMNPKQMEGAMEDNVMLQALQALKYDEDSQETIKKFYKEVPAHSKKNRQPLCSKTTMSKTRQIVFTSKEFWRNTLNASILTQRTLSSGPRFYPTELSSILG